MKKTVGLCVLLPLLLTLIYCTCTVRANDDGDIEAFGLVSAVSGGNIFFDRDSSSVTRAEFTAGAVKALGIDKIMDKKDISYSDVQTDSAYYEMLQYAAANNLISEGNLFRPDEPITMNEAIKICVAATGYRVMGDLYGGYWAGYSKAASQMKLFSGVNSAKGTVDGKTAYRLLYNTLNTNVVEWYSNKGKLHVAETGKQTLLGDRFGIGVVQGIMNANGYTKLSEPCKNFTDCVEISGEYYSGGDTYRDLIGFNVRLYYEEKTERVVFIHPKNNKVVSLASNIGLQFKDNKIIIEGGKRTYTLNTGFDLIYNGKCSYGHRNEGLIPEQGTITLIDNDNDGKYDVVNVYDPQYMKISGVNKIEGIIRGKDAFIDTSDSGCEYLIKNGNEFIEPYRVPTQTALAYAYSDDKRLCTMVICNECVTGTLQSYSTDVKTITIDADEYKYGKYFEENCLPSIKLGEDVEVFLGINGEAVFISDYVSNYEYGYLVNAAIKKGLGGKLQIKIYTREGQFKIFDCREKLMIDGIKNRKAEDFIAAVSGAAGVKPQLIRYRVGSDGIISSFDIKEAGTQPVDRKKDNDDNFLREYNYSASYDYRMKIFYPYFNIEGAAIFKVPGDVTREELFDVNTPFSDGAYSNVTPYDVDEGGSAAAVVYKNDLESTVNLNSDNTIIVVEKTVRMADKDGIWGRGVYGWQAKIGDTVTPEVSYVRYFMDDEVVMTRGGLPSDPQSGDIIRINADEDTIYGATLDFDGSSLQKNIGGSAAIAPFNEPSKALQYQSGSIYSIGQNYMYLSDQKNADGSFDYDLTYLKNVKIPSVIVTCDIKDKKVVPADMTALYDYKNFADAASYVVVKQHYLYSNFAVIYK